MAWTSPMTAVANTALTAAQWNTHVRDNFLETAPAKATVVGSLFAVSATNQIAQRTPTGATVATSQTTTSTSYTDLATVGPAVTVTTSTSALVFPQAAMSNATASAGAFISYGITGATTVSAADTWAASCESAAANDVYRLGVVQLHTGLNPGSNTFTSKYRVTAGTGTFVNRHIAVIPL